MWRKIFLAVKDALFPVQCLGCAKEGEWLCQNCLDNLPIKAVTSCPVCFKPTSDGEACAKCKTNSPLDGLTALFLYQDNSPVGKLIKLFKYNYATDIAAVWKKIIECRSQNLFAPAVVIPVPLFRKRQRERGYNQSQIIAELLAGTLSAEIDSESLQRIKATAQQAKLTRPQRQINVSQAFFWQSKNSVPPNVILVDDVFTTGATMQECAKVLKKNGAVRVRGFVLARD